MSSSKPLRAPEPEPEPSRVTRLRPTLGPAFEGVKDRSIEISPSILPSTRARPRALALSERALVRWLERYAVVEAGVSLQLRRVYAPLDVKTFVGGRRLVVRYGCALVVQALRDMMVWDEVSETWCWRPAIFSPARYLNWYVGQLGGR